MAKVYSLNALMLIACIYLLLLWGKKGRSGYLWGFAFLYGLSLLNHLVMATAAGFLIYVGLLAWRRGEPGLGKELLLAALAWVAGVAPYLFLLTGTGTTGSVLGTILGFLRGLGYVAT